MSRRALDGEGDGGCGDDFADVCERSGRRLGAFYVESSLVERHLHNFGIGSALYRAAAGEASLRGGAIVAGECAGFTTSEDAARVWQGERFGRGMIVSGFVAYHPSPPAATRVVPVARGTPIYVPSPVAAERASGRGAWCFASPADAEAVGVEVAAFRARREFNVVMLATEEETAILMRHTTRAAPSADSIAEAAYSSATDGCAVSAGVAGCRAGVWLCDVGSCLERARR